ncbi:MAG: ferredoxin--NADP reductase [Candidatus Eisenbacteria bacterium]|nr:ferredoxin--NADP reductase [Candidatus Latescibacterota bacterium]MBD3303008.1 ferredoxin--NADP reductase [Candidatus Eisenbacteria bacterium]
MPALDYNATVVQRVEIAPGLVILRVVPDDRGFSFDAGQYTVLGLKRKEPRVMEADEEEPQERADPDKMIRRAYSIASSSKAGEYVEFYLTLVSSGELSPRLFHLGIKDRLYIGPKATGMFTLARVPQDHHVLLVGTGTGLAPYMSMLRSELVCGGPRRFVILHGARYSWDLGYRTELAGLARHCSNVCYLPVISRPGDDPSWNGPSGYLQDVLFSGIIEEHTGLEVVPESFHVFLCGNPAMIEAAQEKLLERGFVRDKGRKTGDLHTEEYW